jgi:transcriptional regulator with XRE-family HTH domain
MATGGEQRVGARIRAARRGAGLSVARLAQETGVSKTYLLRLENDADANPSLDVLRRVADALDLTIADLVGTAPARFVAAERDYPPSLLSFADEQRLSQAELELLGSIRWRKGEVPMTPERWRFVLDSLRASRELDRR